MSGKASPRLNRHLSLEARVDTADGAGGFDENWIHLGALWAQMVPRTGRATARKTLSVSQVDYRITLRAAPVGHGQRPVAGQRFREGSRLFRILSVTEADAAGRYLECIAREEAAA